MLEGKRAEHPVTGAERTGRVEVWRSSGLPEMGRSAIFGRWLATREGGEMVATSRTGRSLGVLLVVAALLAALAVPAAAQYPPGPPPGIECPPAVTPPGLGGGAPPGLERVCEIFGAQPGERFTIRVEVAGIVVFEGEVVADADGRAVFELSLPRNAVGRIVTVTATGPETGVLSTQFRVAGTAEPPTDRGQPVTPGRSDVLGAALAATGSNLLVLAGAGVLLLGLGVAVVRRRSSHGSRVRA
jgi:LPXTG-motif cell wall-anchored protein